MTFGLNAMDIEMKKTHILVVEDDAEMRETLSDILSEEGYEVKTAGRGKEGLALAREEKFPICLIDLKLPDITGIEVLKGLKALNPETYPIIITAFASRDTAIEALKAGACYYIEKPLNIEELLAAIEHASAEQQLLEDKKRAEEEYRSLVESTDDSVYLVDKNCRYLFMNEKHISRLGLSREEILGRPYDAFHSAEETKEFAEKVKRVFDTGISLQHEYKEDEESWYLKTLSPVKDPETGNVIAVTVVSKDITGLKRAEKELIETRDYLNNIIESSADKNGVPIGTVRVGRDITKEVELEERLKAERDKLKESHKFLETVIDNIPDTITIKDSQHRFVLVNQAYCNITGLTRHEVIGKKGEYRETIDEVFQTGRMIESPELTYTDAEGVRRYVHTKKVPLTDESGKITHVMTISHDITEHKRAEEEREQLIKELEKKNAEMEWFTYMVSHDLRSPLVTIQGFVGMLRKDLERGEMERVEKDLKYIENGATKMDRLLNDTLKLSRIGRVANPPEDVPFSELVQEALEETAERIKSSGVEVSVAESFPAVHVDRMRIVEVLVNLIENSISYRGDNPTPKIEIGYRRADGEEPVFFVRDNGIGIDKSQQEKVFGLFFKVDNRSKGTGAGLAIVKRIIEVHNGRVWIESEPGKGCTVCFTLPVAV